MFTVLKHLYSLIEVTLFTLDLTALWRRSSAALFSLYRKYFTIFTNLLCCLDFAGTWMGKFTELQLII